MALWKKILIWFGVAFGLCIIFICILYFSLKNIQLPQMTSGQYDLTKITVFSGSKEELVNDSFSEELFIVVKDDSIESHSGQEGLKEGAYNYVLSNDELLIYFDDDEGALFCAGFYSNNTIRIFIKTDETTYYYYYVLKSEAA